MITIYINQRHVVLRVENYTSFFFPLCRKKEKWSAIQCWGERYSHLQKPSSEPPWESKFWKQWKFISKCHAVINCQVHGVCGWPGFGRVYTLGQWFAELLLTLSRFFFFFLKKIPFNQLWRIFKVTKVAEAHCMNHHWVVKCNGKWMTLCFSEQAWASYNYRLTQGSRQARRHIPAWPQRLSLGTPLASKPQHHVLDLKHLQHLHSDGNNNVTKQGCGGD